MMFNLKYLYFLHEYIDFALNLYNRTITIILSISIGGALVRAYKHRPTDTIELEGISCQLSLSYLSLTSILSVVLGGKLVRFFQINHIILIV